jgi:hypothetical protein
MVGMAAKSAVVDAQKFAGSGRDVGAWRAKPAPMKNGPGRFFGRVDDADLYGMR